jgi:hypothetical protein
MLLLLLEPRAGEFGADMDLWLYWVARVGVLERGAIDTDITSRVPSNQLRPLPLPLMVPQRDRDLAQLERWTAGTLSLSCL